MKLLHVIPTMQEIFHNHNLKNGLRKNLFALALAPGMPIFNHERQTARPMSTIHWKLAFALSPIGILMGAIMVLGLATPELIIPLWVAFSIGTAFMILRYAPEQWFLQALVIGLIWGLFHNIVESVFFDTYLTNNSGYEGAMSNPDFIAARYWVIFTGPLAGIATGCMVGFFVWIIKATRR